MERNKLFLGPDLGLSKLSNVFLPHHSIIVRAPNYLCNLRKYLLLSLKNIEVGIDKNCFPCGNMGAKAFQKDWKYGTSILQEFFWVILSEISNKSQHFLLQLSDLVLFDKHEFF